MINDPLAANITIDQQKDLNSENGQNEEQKLSVHSKSNSPKEEKKNGIEEASHEESDFEAKLNNLKGKYHNLTFRTK